MLKPRGIVAFVMLLVVLSACNASVPTEPVDQGPGVDQATPTASATPPPTATDTESSSHVYVSVSMDTNCRKGPGKFYDYLGGLLVGETAEVLATDPTGHYLYIANPDGPGFCYIWDQYATLTGDKGPLPVYTPEPTPTPSPSYTFAFKGIEQCAIHHSIELTVTNTGPVTWESFELTTVDTTLALTDIFTDDVFADVHACGCDYFDLNLVPGQTGTLGSRIFIDHYPHGESFHVELTLCSLNGLGGECLTQSMDFVVP
jgi:hypothetical protein